MSLTVLLVTQDVNENVSNASEWSTRLNSATTSVFVEVLKKTIKVELGAATL